MPIQNPLSGISSVILEVITSVWLLSTLFRRGTRKERATFKRSITDIRAAVLIPIGNRTVALTLGSWSACVRKCGLATWTRNPLAHGAEDEKSDSSPSKPSDRRRKVRA